MADKKRTLIGDIKENILEKIGKENIAEGDTRGYGKKVEGGVSNFIISDSLPDSPVKVYPKKTRKNPIENMNEFQKVFAEAMLKAYEKQKIPVRYTKEGLTDLALAVSMPGVAAKKIETEKRARIKSGKKREYIEGYTDIASALLRGGPNFVQSASEFVLTPIDYTFGSDFQTSFNKVMDKATLSGDPETLAGGLTQLVAEYAIPIGVATKVVQGAKTWNKIKQLQSFMGTSKASKIAQRMGRDAAILGIADLMVHSGSRPDMRYGINWKIPFTDIGPGRINKPIDTTGLRGRELAKATFINKVRFAKEGTMIGGGFPLVAKSLQLGYKHIARPVVGKGLTVAGKGMDLTAKGIAKSPGLGTYIIPNAAKIIRNSIGYPAEKIISPLIIAAFTKQNPLKVKQQLPPFSEWRIQTVTDPNKTLAGAKSFDNFLSIFRSFSQDTIQMGLVKESLKNKIKSKSRRINKAVEDLEKSWYALAQSFQGTYNKAITSPVGQRYSLDKVIEYLKGQRKLSDLPKEYRFSAEDINKNLEELRKNVASVLPNVEKFADFKKELLSKGSKYMRASFDIFERPKYAPPPKVKEEAINYVLKKILPYNKDWKQVARQDFPNLSQSAAYQKQAERVVNNILYVGKAEKIDPVSALRKIGVNFLRDDKYKFLQKGEDLPDAIRKLLGETVGKNKKGSLRSTVLTTAAELMQPLYTKRAYDYLAKVLEDSGQLVKTEAQAMKWPGYQRINKVPGLGVLGSNIQGKYASMELSNAIKNTGGLLDELIKSSIYRHLLQFKVGTQMGKTVLSPQTQVRNVYSAGFFPFARAHIGGRSSVTDSFKIVLEDIFPKGRINKKDLFDFVEKEIRLGTMDENIISSELGAVLNDIKGGAINSLDEFFELVTKHPMIRDATRLYAGGDTLWKIYGRQYVKSQMSEILPTIEKALEYANHMGLKIGKVNPLTTAKRTLDDILDEISAHEIRNTYPTYTKVPPAIQTIRKLPIANFVAFPAEIVRTATRIVDFNLKQMAHSDPRIRQIGLKASMGTFLAFGGVGVGVTALSQALTGTSPEQWQAYQRSFAYEWDRNANLVAFTSFKDGKAKAFNFSYFSPYDFLQKPITAALRKAEEQNLSPQDTEDYVLELMLAPDGPLMEMLRPFISEQLGIEALIDVQPGGIFLGGRGGRTAEGSQIYSRSDDIGTKVQKSFMHLLNAVEPGAVSTGQKIYKGTTGDLMASGQPVNLKDELLALFSGVRIINVDILKSMGYKTGTFKALLKAVDDTEKIYSPENYKNRGPEIILQEYNQMQLEAYKIQRDFYTMIQDARTIGLSDFQIKKKLRDLGLGSEMIRNIMRGTFTPVNYSVKRFEKKVQLVRDAIGEQQKDNPDFDFFIDKNYLYPKIQLNMLKLSYKFKPLDPEGKYKLNFEDGENPATSGFNILGVLPGIDFRGGPTLKQRTKNLINKLLPGDPMSKIQTPPLGNTPMPKFAANTQQKDPITNLTRTEQALLSPSEKIIAGRT